jgi:hypothetical protein
MSLEERQKLLLKSHSSVVLLLALDVLNGLVQQRHTDRKGTVFDLPTKEAVLGEGVVNPFGRAAFEELQDLGNRESGRQRQEDVNVVGHPSNFEGLHLVLASDPAQEGPESIAQLRRDEGTTLFGAEDAVEIRADVGHAGDSAVPSGLARSLATPPNVETLGYSQTSLRDDCEILVALNILVRSTARPFHAPTRFDGLTASIACCGQECPRAVPVVVSS